MMNTFMYIAAYSGIYLALLFFGPALFSGFDAPAYVLEDPLRTIFVATTLLAYPFSRFVKSASKLNLAQVGFYMSLAGVLGLNFVTYRFTSLSNAGGLTPDLGHLLVPGNIVGVLFFHLILAAPAYTLAAGKNTLESTVVKVVGGYYTLYTLYWLITYIW